MPSTSDTAARPLISPAQVAQFQTDGFCVVENLYAPGEIDAIEAFFEDFKGLGLTVYGSGLKFDEVDPAKMQLRAMHPHRHSERVKQWAIHPRVTAVLTSLLGRDSLLAQTMYYFKPPGAKGQGMHQDNFYVLAAPATGIAAWTAIDDSTIDNGCLVVVPGTNRSAIHCPADGTDTWMSYGDSHIKPFPRDAKPVAVEVPRGATLFFSGNLIHGSGPNRTKDRSRRTFIGHYIDSATDQVATFYHPVLNLKGEPIAYMKAPTGGWALRRWLVGSYPLILALMAFRHWFTLKYCGNISGICPSCVKPLHTLYLTRIYEKWLLQLTLKLSLINLSPHDARLPPYAFSPMPAAGRPHGPRVPADRR